MTGDRLSHPRVQIGDNVLTMTWLCTSLLSVESPELVYALELVLVERVVVLRQDSHAPIFLHQNA